MSATDRDATGPADPLAEARRGRALTVTAAAAHDLRSAASTVAAGADLLMASGLDEQQASYVATMRAVVDDMLALLRDILEAERREAAEPSIEPQPVDLAGFLDKAEAALGVRAAAKGLGWAFRRAPGMPRRVVTDPVRLGQIVSNLIDNAVRLTDEGMVRVGAAAEAEAGEAVRLVLTVEDDGPGFAPEEAERLFEPYVQGTEGARRGGLGLGLAIVKMLAERMGGGVRAEARPRGAAFVAWVRCPLPGGTEDGPASGAGSTDETAGEGGLACLVVDDNLVTRTIAVTLLEGLGHRAAEAASGEDALRLLGTQGFDIAFLDLRMATLHGVATARRIRALGARGSLPLVALTADVRPFDDLRAEGFAACVPKPVNAAVLQAATRHAVPPVRD